MLHVGTCVSKRGGLELHTLMVETMQCCCGRRVFAFTATWAEQLYLELHDACSRRLRCT